MGWKGFTGVRCLGSECLRLASSSIQQTLTPLYQLVIVQQQADPLEASHIPRQHSFECRELSYQGGVAFVPLTSEDHSQGVFQAASCWCQWIGCLLPWCCTESLTQDCVYCSDPNGPCVFDGKYHL